MKNFIQPYNPNWKIEFDRIQKVLLQSLHKFNIHIEHVGSTAVPGLCAKAIIDIDIIIEEKHQLPGISAVLESLGYFAKGEQGVAGRFAFRQLSNRTPQTSENLEWPEHHLYVCFSDSLALKNHLLFRDILLQQEDIRNAYDHLKMRLREEDNITREAYTKRKTAFIINTLAAHGLNETELEEIRQANK